MLALLFKDKSLIITIICSLIIISFVLNPNICIKGCISGASLFFYKVFPSLFPFLVICNIIMNCNGVYIYSKAFGKILCSPLSLPLNCSFVIIVSILCGYPLGAKYSCELYEKKIIDFKTCERLLNIASTASPLFIIGTVGTSMLGNTYIGYILLIGSYLSSLIISFIIPVRYDSLKHNNSKMLFPSSNINLGNTLKSSIENGIKTSLSVGGFIVLFSVINNILRNSYIFHIILDNIYKNLKVPHGIIEGLTLGLIEMTNGCNIISSLNLGYGIKIIFIGFLLGFSGICIVLQCNSFMSKHNFSLIRYIKYKVFQGIISSIISYILYCLFYKENSAFTFKQNTSILFNINGIFVLISLLLFILPIMIYNFKKHIY
nr:sporulation integral membrane protein YlbJ [Clostridium tetanomorphum]